MKTLLPISIFFFSIIYLYGQGEFLIEIDKYSGQYTKIGQAFSGVTWVYPYTRAYDQNNGRYFFPGGTIVPDHIFTINANNGNIIYQMINSNIVDFSYDNKNNILYGLYNDKSNGQFRMSTINPSTGQLMIAAFPIPYLNGFVQGLTAFDENHNRYFILSGSDLFAVDATNGNLLYKTALKYDFSVNQILNFSFHSKADTLLGLIQNSGSKLCQMIYLNPSTGDINRIGSETPYGYGGGNSTIDEANNQFIFFNFSSEGYFLTTLDISNGALIAHSKIPLDVGDNLQSIAYDNKKKKLFAIHWDAQITASLSSIFNATNVSGCTPLTVKFENQSTEANSYYWSFPGGAPSTSKEHSPVVVYTSKGEYDVSLKAYSSVDSATTTKTSYIIVSSLAIPQFANKVKKFVVNFNNQSVDGKDYIWDFGDNSTSTDLNPEHDYNREGEFDVQLKVRNSCGESIIHKKVAVYLIPKVNFTVNATKICVGDYLQLYDLSSNDVLEWHWQIDGSEPSTSKEKTPKVKFIKPGFHSIKLTVKNSNGENSLTKTEYIFVRSAVLCPKYSGKKIKAQTPIEEGE